MQTSRGTNLNFNVTDEVVQNFLQMGMMIGGAPASVYKLLKKDPDVTEAERKEAWAWVCQSDEEMLKPWFDKMKALGNDLGRRLEAKILKIITGQKETITDKANNPINKDDIVEVDFFDLASFPFKPVCHRGRVLDVTDDLGIDVECPQIGKRIMIHPKCLKVVLPSRPVQRRVTAEQITNDPTGVSAGIAPTIYPKAASFTFPAATGPWEDILFPDKKSSKKGSSVLNEGMDPLERYIGPTAAKGERIHEPRAFDLTIGELDRVLSLMMGYAKGIEGKLDEADWQTFKHHVEDMQAAAARILELYKERWKGLTCDGKPPHDAESPPQPKRTSVAVDRGGKFKIKVSRKQAAKAPRKPTRARKGSRRKTARVPKWKGTRVIALIDRGSVTKEDRGTIISSRSGRFTVDFDGIGRVTNWRQHEFRVDQ